MILLKIVFCTASSNLVGVLWLESHYDQRLFNQIKSFVSSASQLKRNDIKESHHNYIVHILFDVRFFCC